MDCYGFQIQTNITEKLSSNPFGRYRAANCFFWDAPTWALCLDYSIVMNLFINGEDKTFADSLSLAQLVEHLGMKGDRVAVELNRQIVPRAQWIETRLKDGDRLEIVHFVGGG
jgi:sulfur carrier protein